MTSTPDADARLIDAHDLALAALHEITPAATVGAPVGYTVEDGGVVSLRFANTMPGYPDWFWTVSVAVVDGAEPTVLETELLPGDGALLAPEWVPWAVRLADYQAAQAALAAEAHDDADDDDTDDEDDVDDDLDDDIDDLDAADFDEDGSPILHAGDVDGVDIDVLDESTDDDADDDEADAEDDESDDETVDDDEFDDEDSDDEDSDDDED